METLYDVLGARPDDDAESLKRAYRKAAKANHPDRRHGDPEAMVRFTRIAGAYDVLRDVKRRAAYDRLLESQREPLHSKARCATSRPAYQLAFKAITGVVVGIVLGGGVRIYGMIGDDAGGTTAGQPPRMVAAEPAKPADTAKGEALGRVLARAPKIQVAQDGAASAGEGKGAWEAAQGPSAPDAAGQTTGRSASSIDPTGPEVSAPPSPAAAAAELDRNEVAALLARGRSLLSNGDVAGARVLLRRAAEHNDPQAALAVGETYDPVVLRHLGVIKFNGDVALAREWYSRAANLGSVAAGDPGRDHRAEPPERPQSTEQKTATMSRDASVTLPNSQTCVSAKGVTMSFDSSATWAARSCALKLSDYGKASIPNR
jgi:curved DNA-binding protein CbpA